MATGILFDVTRCIGCHQCVKQCQIEHNQEVDVDGDLSFHRHTSVLDKGDQYVRRLCMHCEEPACASACPVGALHKLEWGPVVYDLDKCFGCRYCQMACPFGIPTYEWESPNPRVGKCDLCIHLTSKGEETGCSFACPTGATISGPRDELLAKAWRRIRRYPDRYHPHVYGEHEAGGTSTLLIADKPMEEYGYRGDLGTLPLPTLTWNVLEKLPNLVMTGGIFLGGMWWIINRRMHLMELEQHEREAEEQALREAKKRTPPEAAEES